MEIGVEEDAHGDSSETSRSLLDKVQKETLRSIVLLYIAFHLVKFWFIL